MTAALISAGCIIIARLLLWSLPFELPGAGFGWSHERGWYAFAHWFRWRAQPPKED